MKRLAIAVCILGASAAHADDLVQHGSVQRVPADLLRANLADPKASVALFADTVAVGAVLFDDASCAKQFGHAATVKGADRATLLMCLKGLGLEAGVADVGSPIALVGDNGGVIAFTLKGDKIAGLGAVAASSADARLPTMLAITPPYDPSEATRAAIALTESKAVHATVKVCLGKDGAVASRRLVTSSAAPVYDQELLALFATRAPMFWPAVAPGTEVCAIVQMQYPNARRPPTPPPPPTSSSPPPQLVSPSMLETFRVAGSRMIEPDVETKTKMQRTGRGRFVGSFKLCLDTTGTPVKIVTIKSSGYPDYDTKIGTTIANDWRYKPFEVNGRAVPVCTAVTFIYHQD